jgi:hypothetical protein
VITDVPRLEGNRAKNGAAPAQAVTAGALDDAPADWPAKLLAAGLDNGEARIVAQLDAGKTVWRAVRRDAQRRIVYALIRHLTAVGEAATIQRYDAARPAWLPSAALLYQQFDEKWSETVAAALEACPESKGGIDAPSGAPFRG